MLSPIAPNELNYALSWLLMGKIQKLLNFLSKQEGTIFAKRPSHATVPLKNYGAKM
jgi:hypothetical protein